MSEAMHPASDLLRHRTWVRALARKLVRYEHEVDDVEQETWLAALRWPLRRSASPRRWLATVVRRTAMRRLEAARRRAERERRAARRESVPSGDPVAAAEAHERVVRALLALAEPYRTTLLLRFFEDLPPREIAKRMEVPVETVRARVRRGLGRLRGSIPTATLALLGGMAMSSKTTYAAVAAVIGIVTVLVATPVGRRILRLEAAGETPARAIRTAADTRGDVGRDASRLAGGPTDGAITGDPPGIPAAGAPDSGAGASPAGDRKQEGRSRRRVGEGELGPGTGWLLEYPRGTARLIGVVVDRKGVPLAGAKVYRIHESVTEEQERVHGMRNLRHVGTTDAQGRFDVGEQTPGNFLLTADWERLLLRERPPWGLSIRPAVRVDLREGATIAGLEIRMPYAVADLASLSGRVVDDDGDPVHRALATFGVAEAFTDRQGRFRIPHLLPGEHDFGVGAYGYPDHDDRFAVGRAEHREVDVTLTPRFKGRYAIRGRVTDREGAPLAGHVVFLYDFDRQESIRTTRTGADGTYALEKLPAELSGKVHVQVWGDKARKYLGDKKTGVAVPDDHVDFVLLRSVVLTLHVVSNTGEELRQSRGEVFENERSIRSWLTYLENGTHKLRLSEGAFRVVVEAPGHQQKTVEVALSKDATLRIGLDPLE